MSFKDDSWAGRSGTLGDMAEHVFESVYSHGFVRYGLNRPGIGLSEIPAFIRHTPDFLTAKGLVEVIGFGTDQLLKLKDEKLYALIDWQEWIGFRVDIFTWDSWNERYGWMRLRDLAALLPYAGNGVFPEGKTYRSWKSAQLPVAQWVDWHEGVTTRQ